ncbi:MAG TPA: lactonase family protein [Candidatus Eremiobacteraceae bacterium]|nr:lactonase family protein [Candidatus Eremiobacteraceae bacterium]
MKTSRQVFILLMLGSVPFLSLAQAPETRSASPQKYFAYLGTYTNKTTSKGIYAYRFDAATGRLGAGALAAESTEPSFVTVLPGGKYLYAVNETDDFEGKKSGVVNAYAIGSRTGKLTLLNQVASGGADPCYISIDKTGKYVLVANYTSGSIAVFPILPDGKLGERTAFVQHRGVGANKQRQEGPHAHWIETSPDNRFVFAVDLGLDEILVYKFDAENGTLTPNDPPYVKLQPGSGPRHLVFAPTGKFAYLTSELSSTVTALSYDATRGAFTPLQTVSTLPAGYSGTNDSAEIAVHPSGKFLYDSNRGHNSIAIFAIDPADGKLTARGTVSTQGKTPRNFVIDPTGEYLLAENQESNTIVVFKIDQSTGELTPTGQKISAPATVCIAFTPAG